MATIETYSSAKEVFVTSTAGSLTVIVVAVADAHLLPWGDLLCDE